MDSNFLYQTSGSVCSYKMRVSDTSFDSSYAQNGSMGHSLFQSYTLSVEKVMVLLSKEYNTIVASEINVTGNH